METATQRSYIIGGKRYSPDKATLLCKFDGIMHTETLYVSHNGAYFVVSEPVGNETTVNLLTKDKALEFMDNHPAGIIEQNYVKTLGNPQEG